MSQETQIAVLESKVSDLDRDVNDLAKSVVASNRWTIGLLGAMILATTGFLETQIWDLNKSINSLTNEIRTVQVQIQALPQHRR